MNIGPVEVIIFVFPQPEIDHRVIESLSETIKSGAVALIDLVLVTRDGQGTLTVRDFEDDLPPAWSAVTLDSRPLTLLSDSDIDLASEAIAPNETALVAAFEHRWARPLSESVRSAGGSTALHVRIPRDTVVAAVEAANDSADTPAG